VVVGFVFDEIIEPGTLDLTIYFYEGIWNPKSRTQDEGPKHSKRAQVEVKQNDDLKITVEFVCTYLKKDIKMNFFRSKQVRKGHFVETVYEPL
jgi:hypothetical protein